MRLRVSRIVSVGADVSVEPALRQAGLTRAAACSLMAEDRMWLVRLFEAADLVG